MRKQARELIERYRVEDGRKFRLKDVAPDDTAGLNPEIKDEAKDLLARGVERMSELQDMLYAQDRWALLLIFQAMDAAGKDGTIKHVMSGLNPQGCQVHAFKAPSEEELNHDFLWRTTCRLPERGHIGIFNRSYYEEVLVVRVHPPLLEAEKLPLGLIGKNIWKERAKDIRHFESYLARNGTMVRKFFLHVSRKEQRKRFLERLEEPEKNWKFSAADVRERQFWKPYQEAYEDLVRHTATREAPWFVVPADNKWFTRLVVAAAVVEALESMKLGYPEVDNDKRAQLRKARVELNREG